MFSMFSMYSNTIIEFKIVSSFYARSRRACMSHEETATHDPQ